MKQFLLLLIFLFTCVTFSQEKKANYQILKIGNKYSKELVLQAFSTADLCGSYLLTKNNDIIFDDGTVVRLYPKNVLKYSLLNNECFLPDNTDFSQLAWSIAPSAILIKGYQARPNKANSK